MCMTSCPVMYLHKSWTWVVIERSWNRVKSTQASEMGFGLHPLYCLSGAWMGSRRPSSSLSSNDHLLKPLSRCVHGISHKLPPFNRIAALYSQALFDLALSSNVPISLTVTRICLAL